MLLPKLQSKNIFLSGFLKWWQPNSNGTKSDNVQVFKLNKNYRKLCL